MVSFSKEPCLQEVNDDRLYCQPYDINDVVLPIDRIDSVGIDELIERRRSTGENLGYADTCESSQSAYIRCYESSMDLVAKYYSAKEVC